MATPQAHSYDKNDHVVEEQFTRNDKAIRDVISHYEESFNRSDPEA
ncbi:hypothetical protein ACPOL_3252 [Acidisarcina polymorpha]|uniref:Uncharacterized protein n=1 Tax=Acidisarcina polymorpha TaxID=2211140 RepID=A0A2Z5G1M0_9BACT|nr:hypothetical protein ACPOL_3252 [Acidisarcina polymorpha]